eukprot:6905233-Prymnesium_polylepis.1
MSSHATKAEGGTGADVVARHQRRGRTKAEDIYSPDAGVQYHSLERITNPRSTASALVARCHAAGPSPRSAVATYPAYGFTTECCGAGVGPMKVL